MVSVIWIPIVFITRIIQTPGTIRERFAISTMPHLQRHQIRDGEDMSKIRLVDDEGTVLDNYATAANPEQTGLGNSLEYEKCIQKESNSNL